VGVLTGAPLKQKPSLALSARPRCLHPFYSETCKLIWPSYREQPRLPQHVRQEVMAAVDLLPKLSGRGEAADTVLVAV